MISLQEKKKYAKSDFKGAVASNEDDVEVSDATGKYVGKLEILSQLESWKTAFTSPDSRTSSEWPARHTSAPSGTKSGTRR